MMMLMMMMLMMTMTTMTITKTDTAELCRKKKHVACTSSGPSAQYFCVTSRRVCNSQVGLCILHYYNRIPNTEVL